MRIVRHARVGLPGTAPNAPSPLGGLRLQQAKALGAAEVTTEHVLLGLINEDAVSKNGYLDTGLTIERATAAVQVGGTAPHACCTPRTLAP